MLEAPQEAQDKIGFSLCNFQLDELNQAIFESNSANYFLMAQDVVNVPAGAYILEIRGTVGIKYASFELEVNLINPCIDLTLDLSGSSQIGDTYFRDLSYQIGDPSIAQKFMITELYSRQEVQVDCGTIGIQFINDDDSASSLDSTLFYFTDDSFSIIQTNEK